MERYFNVKEKDKKPMFMNFPTILKLTDNNLEIITSKHQEELGKIEFTQDKEGEYSVNSKYSIKTITKEKAEEIIEQRDFEWQCWGDYMSTSDNVASPHLVGPGGNQLA